MKIPRADMPLPPQFVFDDPAAYELMMGRWSALVADPFLDWLALPPGLAWLDDGCGNGSFTESLLRRQRPATVVGVDPSPEQLAFARQRVSTVGVRFLQGCAQALPLSDASVDAAVMALVLFFLADPQQGIRELVRVTRPGGTIILSYTLWWGPFGGHEMGLTHYFGGHRAARWYTRRHGKLPKNLYGVSLFPITAQSGLNWARGAADADRVAGGEGAR